MRRICLIVIAFFVVACGDAVDGASADQDPTTSFVSSTTSVDHPDTTVPPTTSTTTTELATASSRDNPVAVGAVVQVGDWLLRISGLTPDATDVVLDENLFNDSPPEGNQFFIATVEATYTGNESSTFWVDMSLKALGDSNVAYETFEARCGVIPNDIDNSGETFPGGTITGNVCWNIQSSDADSLVMIAEETFTFDDTREFLSLDPNVTPVEESTAVEGNIGAERGPTVAIGESASVGPWEVRAVSITPDATDAVLAENQFNDPPPEGNQFFIATVEARYTGNESSTFWVDMSLKALGDSNVAYEAFEARCGVIPNDIDNSGETFPGGTITGNVCWNIQSSDADSLVMIAEETFTFDDTRVFFALSD